MLDHAFAALGCWKYLGIPVLIRTSGHLHKSWRTRALIPPLQKLLPLRLEFHLHKSWRTTLAALIPTLPFLQKLLPLRLEFSVHAISKEKIFLYDGVFWATRYRILKSGSPEYQKIILRGWILTWQQLGFEISLDISMIQSGAQWVQWIITNV